jgi:hypothetical protein
MGMLSGVAKRHSYIAPCVFGFALGTTYERTVSYKTAIKNRLVEQAQKAEYKHSKLLEWKHLESAADGIRRELCEQGLPELARELRLSKSKLKGSTVLRHLMLPKPEWKSNDLDILAPDEEAARRMSLYLQTLGYKEESNFEYYESYTGTLVYRMKKEGKIPIDICVDVKMKEDMPFLRNEFDGTGVVCHDLDSILKKAGAYTPHGWEYTSDVLQRAKKYQKRGFDIDLPPAILEEIGGMELRKQSS